jgi:hypothetical protein
MALNAQSGIFTIELLTFFGVAGYVIYKWNTTKSFGDEVSDAFSSAGDALGNLGSSIENWFEQEFGEQAPSGWGPYGPDQQTSIAPLPETPFHPGDYNPPTVVVDPLGGLEQVAPDQPGHTQTLVPLGTPIETYSGPVPNEQELSQQVASVAAQIAGSNVPTPTNPPVTVPRPGVAVDPNVSLPNERTGGRNRQMNGFAF